MMHSVALRLFSRIVAPVIVRMLNKLRDVDAGAFQAICYKRYKVTDAMAAAPHFVCRKESDGTYTMGLAGLLNGLLMLPENRRIAIETNAGRTARVRLVNLV